MPTDASALLEKCHFPPPGTTVDLAVSGGPDSLGLLALASAADLTVRVHHVDHGARATSAADAAFVVALCDEAALACTVHEVVVTPGPNFEARARAARRAALPAGALTGHTMDDLAETVLVNLLRGTGLDGLSPMVDDATKPLRDLRRTELASVVATGPWTARHDETNDSPAFQRNRVRHEVLPLLGDVARRDVVPLLARLAYLAHDEAAWLDEVSGADAARGLDEVDCRELRAWPTARLRRWLRARLRGPDAGDGAHPPSAAEVERAIAVVRGEVVATQLSGGRRLARRAQRLGLE